MEIPGLYANGAATAGAASATSNQALDRDAFMQLLVTQLEHQDPLEPVANEDFVAQLANFSSLGELEELNQSIVAMISLNQSNALLSQLTQGSALIEKVVTWTDQETGESLEGSVSSVRIQDGIAVLNVGGQDVPLAAVDEVLGEAGDASSGGSNDGSDDQSNDGAGE